MTTKEILFGITEDNLDTGLRGFPVGTCSTSQVDAQKGLSYRGYLIDTISHRDPEEIIYLLLEGEIPNEKELHDFHKKLTSFHLDSSMIDHLKSLPKSGHPMKWFLSSLNFLGMVQPKNDWREDCLQLIALVPEIVAHIYRIRSNWGEPIAPKPELGYMENFAHMLGRGEKEINFINFIRIFDILHFDHGGGNLSTFSGKVIASGHADMYESMVGAMAGLAGPLHGKANQECLRFLKDCEKNISDINNDEEIENYLQKLLDEKKPVYGFGHAVLRVEDPRATIEYEAGKKFANDDALFQIALKLRKIGPKVLGKVEKIKNPYPNVDAVSGCLLNALGLTDEDYYTVLFGMSRCVGIACQIYIDRAVARKGRGTPIVRPKYIYNGVKR